MFVCYLVKNYSVYIFMFSVYRWHSLSDKGEVFSWGHGGHGQLGHSSIQNQKVPVRIEALANERVTFISCGGSSSAAVTGNARYKIFKDIYLSTIYTYIYVFVCTPQSNCIYTRRY